MHSDKFNMLKSYTTYYCVIRRDKVKYIFSKIRELNRKIDEVHARCETKQ